MSFLSDLAPLVIVDQGGLFFLTRQQQGLISEMTFQRDVQKVSIEDLKLSGVLPSDRKKPLLSVANLSLAKPALQINGMLGGNPPSPPLKLICVEQVLMSMQPVGRFWTKPVTFRLSRSSSSSLCGIDAHRLFVVISPVVGSGDFDVVAALNKNKFRPFSKDTCIK